MKGLIFITFLLYSLQAFSNDSEVNMERAKKHIQKAVLQIPTVKKIKKQVEVFVLRQIPLEKGTIAIIGSTILTAKKGEINTKVIKKFNITMFGGNMRPDLMYNFKHNVVRGVASINWSF